MVYLPPNDRVRETSTGTGTGDLTLSATSDFRRFSTMTSADGLHACANGDLVDYAIVLGSEFEVGLCPWLTGNILGRSTGVVKSSSNGGALVSFGAGTKDIFNDAGAHVLNAMVRFDVAQELTTAQQGVALGNLGAAQNVLVNGKIVESHASNTVTYAIKTLGGATPSPSDPVMVRLGDGSLLAIVAALTVSIASSAVLGTVSGGAFRLWFAIFNNAGTPVLGVRNCRNIVTGKVSGFGGNGLGITANDNASVQITWANGVVLSAKNYAIVGFADYDAGLTTAGTWDASPSRTIQLFNPGMKKPGDVINDVEYTVGTSATGSTQVPLDNTVPQNTEGNEYFTQSIVVEAAQNSLEVEVDMHLSVSTTTWLIGSIFRDAATAALASALTYASTSTAIVQLKARLTTAAGYGGSTTFRWRVGPQVSSTITMNGGAGIGQLLGGALKSSMRIREIMG